MSDGEKEYKDGRRHSNTVPTPGVAADPDGVSPPEATIRGKALEALRAAERAIDDCQNYRSHLHHKELEIVRDAIRSLIGREGAE